MSSEKVVYNFDVDGVRAELEEYLNTLAGPRLKAIIKAYMPCWLSMLQDAPRASFRHENYQGGLLLHTYRVVKGVERVYRIMDYPEIVDYNSLILGAFLHDIGKATNPDDVKMHPYHGAKYVYDVFESIPAMRDKLVLIVGNHMLDKTKDVSTNIPVETLIVHQVDGVAALAGLNSQDGINVRFAYTNYSMDVSACKAAMLYEDLK